MNFHRRIFNLLLVWSVSAALLLSYQNCGGQSFTTNDENQGSTQVYASGGPTSAATAGGISGTGSGGSTTHPTVTSPTTSAESDQNIVACRIAGGPITLSAANQLGTDSSASQVCMTQNACQVLVNGYASVRGCSLVTGAASESSAASQCTASVSGDIGTCENATILSDAQVASILLAMGQ